MDAATQADAFEYHSPTPAQTEAIKKIRAAMKDLRDLLVDNIPNGRERALAITKLEECSMWANKAVVFS